MPPFHPTCSLAFTVLLGLAAAPAAAQEPWSPGESDIVFSEIHYHPPGDVKSEEFIELHNAGLRWVDLGGWALRSAVELEFPAGVVIPPGGYLAVARDAAALRAARKVSNVVGDWKGSLRNRGDIIELRNRGGRVVASIHYHDGRGSQGGLWPERPDGEGPSLELIQPHPDAHRPWYWAPSRIPGGTPGRENSRAFQPDAADPPERPQLIINEYRLEEPGAFVEILNAGPAPAKLDGLKLTTDVHGEGGLPLAGSAPKGKFFVFQDAGLASLVGKIAPDENEPAGTTEKSGKELKADAKADGKGDGRAGGKKGGKKSVKRSARRLFLLDATTLEIFDSVKARSGAPAQGSFGRYPDGEGDLGTCAKSTAGAPNPAPPPSDIVIHEIYYNSQTGSTDDEFIELHNRGKAPVSLKGWSIDRGVSCRFPDDASIPPGGYVVAAGSVEKMRARLSPAESKLIHGPLEGKLSNAGEAILLVDARGDEADRVRYSDRQPWPRDADGRGFSLELLHPDLDNRWPQAWTLGPGGGTPGRKNARAVKSMPPAIGSVRHDPPIPGPEDAVTVHAQVVDNGGVSSVSVVYRDIAAGGAAKKTSMADAGRTGDGAPKDGHYAARLPRLRVGAIIGFAIFARDGSGREVRAPEGGGEFYFQVEPKAARSARGEGARGMPVYRILMPPEAWDRLIRSPRRQDSLFPCTFIASVEGEGVNERKGDIFYHASIRFRGNQSRSPQDGRMSYRLRIENGDRFDGRDRFILNAYDSFRQKAGGDAFRLSGILTSNADVVRLKTPTFDDPRYLAIEVVNNEFLDDKFGSSTGRLYRGRRGAPPADLAYRGPEARNYLAAYQRVNRKNDSDISELLGLLQALDERNPEAYVKKVEAVLDPAEWAAYFALNNALGNNEGGLSIDEPDDYFLAQRPSDGKFLLVPWDQDSTFTETTLPLFRPRLPAIRRLLQHPRYAPYYHRAVRELVDGPLSRPSFTRRQSFYSGIFEEQDLAALERFVERRQAWLRDRYPFSPQAGVPATGEGFSGFGSRTFLPAGAEGVTIEGIVDPAVAFGVRVAGSPAEYDAVRGRFTWKSEAGSLVAGPNAIWIELLGALGEAASMYPLNVEQVRSISPAPTFEGKKEWKAADGPLLLSGNALVPAGSTLKIGPGVSIICAPGSSLLVRGTLSFEGTALEPVTFRPADTLRGWNGIRFIRGGGAGGAPQGSLSHCRFEGGEGRGVVLEEPLEGFGGPEVPGVIVEPGRPAEDAFFRADGTRVVLDHCLFRGIQGTAVGLFGSAAEIRSLRIASCRAGLAARGGSLKLDGADISRIQGVGLRLSAMDGEGSSVKDFSITDALDSGIVIEGGKMLLENGVIHGSRAAVSVSGGARVAATHVTLAGNGCGAEVDRPRLVVVREAPVQPVPVRGQVRPPRRGPRDTVKIVAPEGRSRLELTRSILGPCHEPVIAADGSHIEVSSSIVAPVSGTRVLEGKDLLVAFPRFAAAHRGDFRLEKGSPGQGRGPGGADWGR